MSHKIQHEEENSPFLGAQLEWSSDRLVSGSRTLVPWSGLGDGCTKVGLEIWAGDTISDRALVRRPRV